MRMFTDEGADSVVQLFEESDILDAVLLHLVLCPMYPIVDILPEIEAFVLDLLAQSEEGPDEGKAVHEEPLLLDRLDYVNGRDGRKWGHVVSE